MGTAGPFCALSLVAQAAIARADGPDVVCWSQCRSRTSCRAVAQISQQAEGTRTVMVKNTPGEMPFPWSEKDPYKLPASIDRVQKMLITLGEQLLHGGAWTRLHPCGPGSQCSLGCCGSGAV